MRLFRYNKRRKKSKPERYAKIVPGYSVGAFNVEIHHGDHSYTYGDDMGPYSYKSREEAETGAKQILDRAYEQDEWRKTPPSYVFRETE